MDRKKKAGIALTACTAAVYMLMVAVELAEWVADTVSQDAYRGAYNAVRAGAETDHLRRQVQGRDITVAVPARDFDLG